MGFAAINTFIGLQGDGDLGETASVISGLRQMASKRKLTGEGRMEIATVCRYFENNSAGVVSGFSLHDNTRLCGPLTGRLPGMTTRSRWDAGH